MLVDPELEECFAFFCHSPLPGDWYLVTSYNVIIHEKAPTGKLIPVGANPSL